MIKRSDHLIHILITVTLLVLPVHYAFSAETPQIKKDKSLIVFYREKSFSGSAIRFNLNQGQEPIGSLLSGTMLYRYVAPGQHTFWSQVVSKDAITIGAVAGKTYYIRGVTKMGLVAGRPRLILATESEAKAAIAKLK